MPRAQGAHRNERERQPQRDHGSYPDFSRPGHPAAQSNEIERSHKP